VLFGWSCRITSPTESRSSVRAIGEIAGSRELLKSATEFPGFCRASETTAAQAWLTCRPGRPAGCPAENWPVFCSRNTAWACRDHPQHGGKSAGTDRRDQSDRPARPAWASRPLRTTSMQTPPAPEPARWASAAATDHGSRRGGCGASATFISAGFSVPPPAAEPMQPWIPIPQWQRARGQQREAKVFGFWQQWGLVSQVMRDVELRLGAASSTRGDG